MANEGNRRPVRLLGTPALVILAILLSTAGCTTNGADPEETDVRVSAEKLVADRGWDDLANAEVIVDSFVRIANASTVFDPVEVMSSIRDHLKDIVLLPEDGWPYQCDGIIYLPPSMIKYCTILHETTHAISLYYAPFPFASADPVTIGTITASYRLCEGLTDYFGYRGAEEYCESFRSYRVLAPGKTVSYQANICQNVGYPDEYGLALSFLYAAGSEETERAFFDREYGEAFAASFDRSYGEGKLAALIGDIDALVLYLGYTDTVCLTDGDRDDAFERVKTFIQSLVSILEKRHERISTESGRESFGSDLGAFRELAVTVSDDVFTASVEERLAALED